METELLAAAGKPTEEMESVLVATQVVVNAILDLLDVGAFRPGAGSLSSHLQRMQRMSHDLSAAMQFVVGLAAAGRVLVPPGCALQLLYYLAQQSSAQRRAAKAGGVDYETMFVRILVSCGINGSSQAADPQKLSAAQAEVVMQLALDAGFQEAVATIHHLQGNFAAALQCHLAKGDASAFGYIDRYHNPCF